MQTDIILKYYWDIFLSHICEFYPLQKEFIEKYEHELDWNAISLNQKIEWDTDFLTKYENRFLWYLLGCNEAISWTSDRIEKFKKRLDWHYLMQNKNLPVTEDFIIKYSKKLVQIEESNPFYTYSLKEKYKIKLTSTPFRNIHDIKDYNDDDFEVVFNSYGFYQNQIVIYDKVFLPIISETNIESIFKEKFDYSQRYYFMRPVQDDIKGLTPEFVFQGSNPFGQYKEGRGFFPIVESMILTNGPLQEGSDRLYEMPRISFTSYYPIILVSEDIKSVLENFKLPNHIFHPVNLVPKKVTTNTKYYILQFEYDTLTKDLSFDSQSFYFMFRYFNKRGFEALNEKIGNYKKYEETKERLKLKYDKLGYDDKLYPNKYLLNSDFDIYSCTDNKGDFIVNQILKDVLEKNFPGQLLFTSAQLLNIKIDQDKYDKKNKLISNIRTSQKLDYKESEEDNFYFQKMERLELRDAPYNKKELGNDNFTAKEQELNVIFPTDFKINYFENRIKIPNFNMLNISEFYIQNEFAERYPETYKSVIIAENGFGDSVGLILERNSDNKLQAQLFEFLHETGEYEKV